VVCQLTASRLPRLIHGLSQMRHSTPPVSNVSINQKSSTTSTSSPFMGKSHPRARWTHQTLCERCGAAQPFVSQCDSRNLTGQGCTRWCNKLRHRTFRQKLEWYATAHSCSKTLYMELNNYKQLNPMDVISILQCSHSSNPGTVTIVAATVLPVLSSSPHHPIST
jgi:hypothetical protein